MMGRSEDWELDFYYRPLVDVDNRKIWELLIHARTGWRFERRCSPQEANATWLRENLQIALAEAPAPPQRVLYFRPLMSGIVERACKELDLQTRLTRRTFYLDEWLRARERDLYPGETGYQPPGPAPAGLERAPARPLPDALRGERWAFVALSAIEIRELKELEIPFGEQLNFTLPPVPVPGVVIFSKRAEPLAAWMSGVDPASLYFQPGEPASLLLEAGVEERWVVVSFRDPQIVGEGEDFERAKERSAGHHFLVIQRPGQEEFTGFWSLHQ